MKKIHWIVVIGMSMLIGMGVAGGLMFLAQVWISGCYPIPCR